MSRMAQVGISPRAADAAGASFNPFAGERAVRREIEPPPDMAGEDRARLIAKLQAVVRMQKALAERCDAFLRVTGEVIDAGGRILIPHEEATPADPSVVQQSEPRPDIQTLWWLAWTALRALDCLGREGIVHGGIQLRTLYQDQTGRLKLGDVGLVPAFQTVLRADLRRFIRCVPGTESGPAGGRSSGVWALPDTNDRAGDGWISPYFAHELFLDRTRPDWKTDQFALGVMLYLFATGAHPFGADLTDPEAAFFYRLDPAPIDEQRAEWRSLFGRQAQKIAGPSDRPVLDWSNMALRMIAGMPEDRFQKDILSASGLNEHVPRQWSEISAAIEAVRPGAAGRVSSELAQRSAFWVRIPQLPSLWRQKIDLLRGSRHPSHDVTTPESKQASRFPISASNACEERDRQAAEVELERHWIAGELDAACADLEASRFAAVRRRVDLVARHPQADPTQLSRAEQLRRESETREHAHTRAARSLYQGRLAARDGDVASVEECLSHTPRELPNADLTAARNELAAGVERLRALQSQTTPVADHAGVNITAPELVERQNTGDEFLEFITASGRRFTAPLPENGAELIVGRGRRAAYRLPEDPWISSAHLRIYRDGGRILVADLGSRHGTQVNGAHIAEPTALASGDEIRLGISMICFVATRSNSASR